MGMGGANSAYANNAWVNIAITRISKNFARAQFKAVQKGTDREITLGPIWDLFTNVNPQMSRAQLWQATTAWRASRGESIWTFEDGFDGLSLPKEIYVHDPRKFTHRLNPQESKITMWAYNTPDGKQIPLFPSEIVHMATWNPFNEFRGVNPLVAHEALLNQDFLADQFNLFLLKNRSTPEGVLSTDDPLTDPQAQEYIERWEEEHRGASRSHRISVLGNGLEYQKVGLTPAEMEFLSMHEWNRIAIMAAYGIPPAVAGFRDETSPLSGKDTKEQNLQFWTQAILPEIAELRDKMVSEFSNRWTPDVEYIFDVSLIPELQEDIEKLRQQIREDVKVGLMTIDEGRDEMKRSPVPWGNTWWKPFGLVDVTAPTPEPAKVPPPAKEPPPKKEITSHTPLTMFDVKQGEPLDIFIKDSDYGSMYPEIVKSHLWKSMKESTYQVEEGMVEAIGSWLFAQRSNLMEACLSGSGELEEGYWEAQAQKLVDAVQPIVIGTIEKAEGSLKELYELLDMESSTSTDAGEGFVAGCCDSMVSLCWKMKQMVEGISDIEGLRKLYNEARNRVKPMARLEVGRIYNSVRMKGFQLDHFEYHEWLSDRGDKNPMDGEVVEIGNPFSNGQTLPIDIERNRSDFTLPILKSKAYSGIDTKAGKPSEGMSHRAYLEVQLLMDPFEAAIVKIVADFWTAQETASLGMIKTAKNVEEMENFVRNALWDDELNDVVKPTMGKTFERGRKRVFSRPGTPMYSPSPKESVAFLAQRGVKIKDHVEGIKRLLIADFKAPGRNLTIEQLGEALAPKIQHTFGIAEVRSRKIARTEVTAAFNGGMLEGMIETKQSLKQWINSGDGKVRGTHQIDQVVPTKEFFTLGDGEQVMYPGDGSAANSINCRCTMQAIVIPDGEIPIV